MTRERANELKRKQGQWPHWGNYRKFMTADEIAYVEGVFKNAVNGNVTFTSIIRTIAYGGDVDAL